MGSVRVSWDYGHEMGSVLFLCGFLDSRSLSLADLEGKSRRDVVVNRRPYVNCVSSTSYLPLKTWNELGCYMSTGKIKQLFLAQYYSSPVCGYFIILVEEKYWGFFSKHLPNLLLPHWGGIVSYYPCSQGSPCCLNSHWQTVFLSWFGNTSRRTVWIFGSLTV